LRQLSSLRLPDARAGSPTFFARPENAPRTCQLRQGRIYIFRQFLDSFDAVQQRLRLIEAIREHA